MSRDLCSITSRLIASRRIVSAPLGSQIDDRGSIAARTEGIASRGRKTHACHFLLMPAEAEQFLAGLGVPEFCRVVAAAGQDPPAVRREGDRGDGGGVAVECPQESAGCRIPEVPRLSSLPVITDLSSCEKTPSSTAHSCPASTRTAWPESASQMRGLVVGDGEHSMP